MEVILHSGVHCTDEDRLLKGMLKNAEAFRDLGVAIPGPSRYRRLIRDTLNELRGAAATSDTRDILLEALVDIDQPRRLVLSNDNFFCVPKIALSQGTFYPQAGERMRDFADLFRGDRVQLFMAIRNPATFLPALFHQSPGSELSEFLGDADPLEFAWSELVARLRSAAPDVPITLWCNEDSPLIWGEILRAMAGLPSGTKITGSFDLLAEIMTPEGMTRFRTYLRSHPSMSEVQKRRVMVAFLARFAIKDAVVEELDLPGWTEDLVTDLTEAYEEDLLRVAAIPGVSILAP